MKEKVIYVILIKKANSDLKVALREYSNQDSELEIVCFHLQQFVEKYLKAYLYFKGKEPKKNHNIVYLLQECIITNKIFDKYKNTKLIELNECGVEIRYDEVDEINRNFLDEVIKSVLNLKVEIENEIAFTI
ncbi:MAG: HEPN domain-containing protein [bacterium]